MSEAKLELLSVAELAVFLERLGDTGADFDEEHGITGGHDFYDDLISYEHLSDIDQSNPLFAQYRAAFAAEDLKPAVEE